MQWASGRGARAAITPEHVLVFLFTEGWRPRIAMMQHIDFRVLREGRGIDNPSNTPSVLHHGRLGAIFQSNGVPGR